MRSETQVSSVRRLLRRTQHQPGPTLVLAIPTCFLNIVIPPEPKATNKLGGMRQAPRQGPYLQVNDDLRKAVNTKRTFRGCNPDRPFMAL